MVDTIGPMVRAARSPGEGRVIQIAHGIGGTLGGGVTGFAVGGVGALAGADQGVPPWIIGSAAVLALASALFDLARQGGNLGLGRQTPRAWRHVLPAPTAAFLNGFDLGLGWSTRLYVTSYLIALMAAALSGHALAGAAIGAAFGASRSLFVVAAQRRADGSLAIDSFGERRGRALALNSVALAQFAVVGAITARSLW